MVRYAFRVGESGRNLSPAENISSMVVADREAREPFLPASPKLAHANGDSIIADLLADDVIHEADICRPASVNYRHHVQVAFTFGLACDAFSA
jgi:hypothetical protein